MKGICTRFYGDRPPNILVDEGKFFIEKGTWLMYLLILQTGAVDNLTLM